MREGKVNNGKREAAHPSYEFPAQPLHDAMLDNDTTAKHAAIISIRT